VGKSIVSKHLSYGLVEIVDNGGMASQRYSLLINGSIRKQSSDWSYIKGEYDKLY